MTETKATVNVVDLYEALRIASLFTATNDNSSICAVRLEADASGTLTAVATDRYALGTYQIRYEGDAFDVLLALADVKTLLTTLKPLTKFKNVTVDVLVEDSYGVPGLYVRFRHFDGEIRFPRLDADFPRWRSLFPTQTNDTGTIGLNPTNVARFAKVADKTMPMVLTFNGPLKPVVVTIGDAFRGLIMPMRIGG